MKRKSDRIKFKENYGTGKGSNYKPWIRTREFSRGLGTRTEIKDPINNRLVHLLSLNELYAYLLIRFESDVTDIREQYPLPIDKINEIADYYGFKRIQNGKFAMTTDLLVTKNNDYTNGLYAYSIKDDVSKLNNRDKERLLIEKTYWNQLGVPFILIQKSDLDINKANNLRILFPYYDKKSVVTEDDLIKHLIITKQIEIDLSVREINFEKIKKDYLEANHE